MKISYIPKIFYINISPMGKILSKGFLLFDNADDADDGTANCQQGQDERIEQGKREFSIFFMQAVGALVKMIDGS
jgi:hypothetical protein